jgi:hypothetical protein
MLQSYEGYLEADGRFYPIGSPLKIVGNRQKVRVIEIEEQEPKSKSIEEKLARMAEFDRMVADSADENYIFDDFESARTNRELIVFDEE